MRGVVTVVAVLLGAACQSSLGALSSGDDASVREEPDGDGGATQPDVDAAAGGGDGGDAGGGAADDPWAAACPWVLGRSYTRPSDAFFEPSVVIELELEMAPEDWRWLLDNPDLEEYRPAALTVCGQRLEGVGLRFRKSTHPNADLPEGYPKSPMLIAFSEFAAGQKLRGLRHANLEYGGDQMLVAERASWELLDAAGVEASRVGSVRLAINGEVIGVFNNVERVDRSFALFHYGDDDGNLYKHAYCGTFQWRGEDPAEYLADPRCYEKKTNEVEADYSDLIHVIDVLGNTPDDELEAALPEVLDVDGWIPLMAALQVLGYGDSPNANGNNFFTYASATTGRFEIIPWDLDGGFFLEGAPCEQPADTIGWSLFRVSRCYDAAELPLFTRVVDRPAWRDRYLRAARDLVDGPFAPEPYATRVEALRDLLGPALASDPNRDGDDAAWDAVLADLVERQAARADSVRRELEAEGY